MHVVMTGTDATIFEANSPSDTRARMLAYAAELKTYRPDNRLTYLVLGSDAAPYTEGNFTAIGIPGRRFEQLFGLHEQLTALSPIDVIASQSPYEEAIPAYLYCRTHKTAHVVQVHDDLFRGGFVHAVRKLIAKFIIPRSTLVRCVNPTMESQLKARFNETHITFIPVPITLLAKQHDASAPPSILFVGRIAPEKDLPLWLETAAHLHRDFPALRFDIVGPGNSQQLQQQAKNLGLEECVTFHGPVANEDLGQFYSRASVFLLTSKHEGFGRVLIEAMLHEVPVVSTSTTGTRTILAGQNNGVLVEPRTPEALAHAIIPLLQDTEKARQMGLAGASYATRYAPASAIQAWVKALTDVTPLKRKK